MGVPLCQFFREGEEPANPINFRESKVRDDLAREASGKGARVREVFWKILGQVNEGDRRWLLQVDQKMAQRTLDRQEA
jgi:hypothetical protein